MTIAAKNRDASQLYATANAAHYTAKDLRAAIGHYDRIIAAHPDSAEAGDSRTQLLHIAKSAIAGALLSDRHGRAPDHVSAKLAS